MRLIESKITYRQKLRYNTNYKFILQLCAVTRAFRYYTSHQPLFNTDNNMSMSNTYIIDSNYVRPFIPMISTNAVFMFIILAVTVIFQNLSE